jgi:hypothetical protein
MSAQGLFVAIPLWGVFIATLLLVLLAVEGGYHWARSTHRSTVEQVAPVGAMVGALLGLFAFLLTFTFGMAATRYHDRQLALLQETNAIRATYMQAEMLAEPHRTAVRTVLRNYVQERLQWVGVAKAQAGLSWHELLDQLWAQAAAVGAHNPGGVDVFLNSVSAVINLRAERMILRERSHIPSAFWAALYVVAILALAAMGYHGGVAGTHRSPVALAVAIAFAVVILLIAALDRPGEGLVNVSQQAMIDLHDWMARSNP